jgi:hypothetical protein
MEENQNTNEQSKSMMDQASEKLHELKEKGAHFADIAKEKAEELWDEVKSGKLKEEASAKLSELAAKGGKEFDDLKEKAGEVWEDLKSGKLKDEAGQKLAELKDDAKELWAKMKGEEKKEDQA